MKFRSAAGQKHYPRPKDFRMERAREELRDVTRTIATAEMSFRERQADDEIENDSNFTQYMKRLQDRRSKLQEEVLQYLGLHWVAPPSTRDRSSGARQSLESSPNAKVQALRCGTGPVARERATASEGTGRPWVRADDEHITSRPTSFMSQAAAECRIRLPPVEETFRSIGYNGGDGAPRRGSNAENHAGYREIDVMTSRLGSRSEVRAQGQVLHAWGFSNVRELPTSPKMTSTAVRVTPHRQEHLVAVAGDAATEERRRWGTRSPSPIATQQQQQQQQQLELRPLLTTTSGCSPPSAIGPVFSRTSSGEDGSGRDAKRLRSTVLPTPVPVTATEDGAYHDWAVNGTRFHGPRIVPEEFYGCTAARRCFSPAHSRRPSGDAGSATSALSSESDLADDGGARVPSLRNGLVSSFAVARAVAKRPFESETSTAWTEVGGSGPSRSVDGDSRTGGPPRGVGTVPARARGVALSERSSESAGPKGSQACRDVGCHRRPIYAFKGDTKALCCPIHRSEEMVNVRHPLCRHESCFRQPSFGMEGDKRASYCSEHKHPKMINVSSRRCRATGCLRHPNFGFQGDRRATFCCRHKAPGMVDVVSRRCKQPQCVRRPLYAMVGQRAIFCRTHKEPGMTDVVSRRCNFEEGCDRHPSFGWKHGDGKARRCAHHRLEGMESVKVNRRNGPNAPAVVGGSK